MKRTHLAGLGVLRPIAEQFGLTPARFDLMRVVALHREWGIPQWKLVRLLGVAATVVSRMLRQLEALGFVERSTYSHDRRYKRVHLTDEGEVRVQSLLRDHQHDDHFDCMAHVAFSPPKRWSIRDVYRRLSRARRMLGDTAPFLHPWRLADVFDEERRPIRIHESDLKTVVREENRLIDSGAARRWHRFFPVPPRRPRPDISPIFAP